MNRERERGKKKERILCVSQVFEIRLKLLVLMEEVNWDAFIAAALHKGCNELPLV